VRKHALSTKRYARFPRFFSREQAKHVCDWVAMTSVFVASQSRYFFSARANKFALWKTGFEHSSNASSSSSKARFTLTYFAAAGEKN
jgi:hypothetical protein